MELQTISQISKLFHISTRTLRYYEQIGLIQPTKKEDFAYRTYDENAVLRLQQIIVLRKLRIPLKQIGDILGSEDASVAIHAFEQNLAEIQDEITALSTIKTLIESFLERLHLRSDTLGLLDDVSLLEIVDTLTASKINFKEEKTMDDLSKASEKLSRLTDKDVRIVYLPPMTIAAAFATGEGCEGKAGAIVNGFVKASGLLAKKPDARSFGFDCSQGKVGIGENSQVYEMWVSIPPEMDVPAPLRKVDFYGGLYAAHVLRTWDFEDWRLLGQWVHQSEKYENDYGTARWTAGETNMGQGFEEQLNYYSMIQNPGYKEGDLQLDLLFPIKEKQA